MFNLFRKKNIKTKASELADQLDLVGYFSFLIDNKCEIKNKFIEHYNSFSSYLPVLNEDIGEDKIISLDNRSYFAEATSLYDLEFFKVFLDRIKPTFTLLNVPFHITNMEGGWDTENLEYNLSVHINNNRYELLTNFHNGFLGYAVYKIAEMVNDVLAKNKCNNRVYLTGQGEIIAWHFLTLEQFDCAFNHYEKKESKPMKIDEWLLIAEKGNLVFFKNQA
jgi:hypothetical protein